MSGLKTGSRPDHLKVLSKTTILTGKIVLRYFNPPHIQNIPKYGPPTCMVLNDIDKVDLYIGIC